MEKSDFDFQQKDEKPIVLRKRRQRIKSEANWPLFYYYFNRDHTRPNLIWNFKVTRCAGRNLLHDVYSRGRNISQIFAKQFLLFPFTALLFCTYHAGPPETFEKS